jgi:PAS domain S-box-containing protein
LVADELPHFLTAHQAASLIGVQPDTLHRWEQQGKIPALRVGPRGARRYSKQALLRLIELNKARTRNVQQMLVDVARAIASSLDLNTVAQTVVDAAVRIVGSDRCAIYLLDLERDLLQPLVGIDVHDPQSVEQLFYPNPIPLDAAPLIRWALEHPEPIVIDDTEIHPLSNPEMFRLFNTRTLINVGLRGPDGRVFGMMPFIWVGQPHAVSDDEQFYARSIAAMAELSLSNARLFAQIEQERARAMAISEIVLGVNSRNQLNEVLTRAINSLVEQLAADEGAIWLTDQSGTHIVGAAETRLHGPTRLGAVVSIAGSPNIARAVEHKHPLLVPYADALGEERQWFESLEVQASLFVPLLMQDHLVGMAFVNYLRTIPHLRPDDLRFAGLLAAQCAIAIERVQLLEAASTRAAELEAIFEALTVSIIISDRAGQLLRANAATERILGLGPQVPDLLTRIARLNIRHIDGTPLQVEQSPTARALRGETVTNMELVFQHPSGEERLLLCSSAPIYDSRGAVRAAVVAIRDVTDVGAMRRQNIELADSLQRKVAELEAVITQMGEGIIITDHKGRIVLVNDCAAALHGVAQLDIAPDEYSNTYHLFRLDGTPYPSLELPLSRAVLYGETVTNAEWRIRRPDGSEIIAQGSATPIVDATGERLGAVLVLRDITARHQLEAEKEQFLSVVSHELRTPLTTIKGLNDLAQRRLVRGADPNDVLQRLQGVSHQVRRMEGMINDLLDIRRLETGELPLMRVHSDFVALVVEAYERARAMTEAHTIKLIVDAPQPLMMFVDEGRIEQVLNNLLSNAIKYSPDGGEIVLELTCVDRYAELRVRDQGVGIPEVDRERLFQRFYRGSNVTSSVFSGLGIGLALSLQLAVSHGGTLMVESTGAQGSTFLLRLPLLRYSSD